MTKRNILITIFLIQKYAAVPLKHSHITLLFELMPSNSNIGGGAEVW
jgi:hypothetical protein